MWWLTGDSQSTNQTRHHRFSGLQEVSLREMLFPFWVRCSTLHSSSLEIWRDLKTMRASPRRRNLFPNSPFISARIQILYPLLGNKRAMIHEGVPGISKWCPTKKPNGPAECEWSDLKIGGLKWFVSGSMNGFPRFMPTTCALPLVWWPT